MCGDQPTIKLWGVLYISHLERKVLANFTHVFSHYQVQGGQEKTNTKLRLRLISSSEENCDYKKSKLNIALKYDKYENKISIIVFKCCLEVAGRK